MSVNSVVHGVPAKFGEIASVTSSLYGGYSIYGLKANPLGKRPDAALHGAWVDIEMTDHDEAWSSVSNY